MQDEHDTSKAPVNVPRDLILRAFEEAYLSGKPDWRRMTTAVLKNRLLSSTNRDFNETRYGATSFMGFVSGYPDVLRVDRSQFPPVVELIGEEWGFLTKKVDAGIGKPYRIRVDLWQAALDYSSGTRYVWDYEKDEVRPSVGNERYPVIDTISAEMQNSWRRQFLDENEHAMNLTQSETDESDEWVQFHLQTRRLPARLVPYWNRFFRDKVLAHLENWFSQANVPQPRDLVSRVDRPLTGGPKGADELRDMVMSVVQKMTYEELSNLELPAQAVLRATQKSKS